MGGGPAALGRAAGVEDLKAVLGALVQRQVRVAEDHGVGVGRRSAGASARAAPPTIRRRGSARCGPARPPRPARRGAAGAAPRCRRCRARPRAEDRSAPGRAAPRRSMKSPAWTSRSAASMRSTKGFGRRRPPRGMWVSEMTATTVTGLHSTAPAPVAQWIERCPPEAEVAGSNPAGRVVGSSILEPNRAPPAREREKSNPRLRKGRDPAPALALRRLVGPGNSNLPGAWESPLNAGFPRCSWTHRPRWLWRAGERARRRLRWEELCARACL